MRLERKASEELIRQSKLPVKSIASAANVGATLAGGISLSRALPLLSRYLPIETAIKGLEKISPKLKSFFSDGFKNGLDAESGLEFLRGKAESTQEENLSPLEKKRRDALGKFNEGIKKRKLAEEEQSRVQQTYPQYADKQPMQQESQQTQQVGAGQQALLEMLRKINASLGQ